MTVAAHDGRVFLAYGEAVARLPDGETIHTYTNPAPGLMLGCDVERGNLLKLLLEAKWIEESGPTATAAHHGIAIWRNNGWLFIQTRKP